MTSKDFRYNKKEWPGKGLVTVANCPVCGFHGKSLLYENLSDTVFFCAPGLWSMYQCDNCRSAYLNPKPSAKTIHLAYEKYYTHAPPLQSKARKLTLLRILLYALENGYLNRRFGTNRQPASRLGLPIMYLCPWKRYWLEDSMRYLPKSGVGSKVLDVGFGGSEFLELAKEAGWIVSGADPDPKAVEKALTRDLDVRQGGIEAYADQHEIFDVLTLNSVIEHVQEPIETLRLAYNLLKPGGMLYIKTPNIDAFGHSEFKANWRGLEPPRHIAIFTWKSLEALLFEAGFRSIKRRYRINVYPNLAAKSRAISQGRDPYISNKVTVRDRVKGFIAKLKTLQNIRNSELVILIAYKPNFN